MTSIKDASTQTLVETEEMQSLGRLLSRGWKDSLCQYTDIYIYIIYIYMYTWEPTTFIFRGYIFVGLKPAFFHGFGVHPGSPVLDYFFHGFSVKTIVFVRVYSVGYVSSLEGSPFYNRDQHGWIGVNLSMTKYQWNPWSIGF